MLNEVSRHVAHLVRHCLDHQVATVEPSAEAEKAWVDNVMSFAGARRAFDEECTPGYYNNEGMPGGVQVRNGFYGGGSLAFIKLLNDWRARGDFAGIELSSQP
jgi:cyclohexanone monooxygenase